MEIVYFEITPEIYFKLKRLKRKDCLDNIKLYKERNMVPKVGVAVSLINNILKLSDKLMTNNFKEHNYEKVSTKLELDLDLIIIILKSKGAIK